MKLGIDPTASDIHLGFAVVLRKLRQFQELGHVAVLIIGDFTAQVGDPSGRRPPGPASRRRRSTATPPTYVEQVAADPALDEPLEIRRNSEWLGTMGIEDVLRLAAAHHRRPDARAGRLLAAATATASPISVMEFLYPLLQGWDSVDGARPTSSSAAPTSCSTTSWAATSRSRRARRAQVVLTTPLLEGLDGVQKMSKSLGNYVGHRRAARASSSASSCRCPTS